MELVKHVMQREFSQFVQEVGNVLEKSSADRLKLFKLNHTHITMQNPIKAGISNTQQMLALLISYICNIYVHILISEEPSVFVFCW